MNMFTFTKDDEVLHNEVSLNSGRFTKTRETAALRFVESVNRLSAMCFGKLVNGLSDGRPSVNLHAIVG